MQDDSLYDEQTSSSSLKSLNTKKAYVMAVHEVASKCLLEVLSVHPGLIQSSGTQGINGYEWFLNWLKYDSVPVRENIAQAIPLVIALYNSSETANVICTTLVERAKNVLQSQSGQRHGSVLAIGYVLQQNGLSNPAGKYDLNKETEAKLTSVLVDTFL